MQHLIQTHPSAYILAFPNLLEPLGDRSQSRETMSVAPITDYGQARPTKTLAWRPPLLWLQQFITELAH